MMRRMINRYMYMGYGLPGDVLDVDSSGIDALSFSFFDGMVFMYFEADTEVNPHDIAGAKLASFPTGERWRRMFDIFHSSVPRDGEHWRRKLDGKKPWIRVNRLKPEMIASYIFYHFQYQEERPGEGDKYEVIFLCGNLMVMYQERPIEHEENPAPPGLDTKNTPSGWGELMNEHFIPWENGGDCWQEIYTREI